MNALTMVANRGGEVTCAVKGTPQCLPPERYSEMSPAFQKAVRLRDSYDSTLGCGEIGFYAYGFDDGSVDVTLEVEFSGSILQSNDPTRLEPWIPRVKDFADEVGGKIELMDHPERDVKYSVEVSVWGKTDLGVGNTKARVYAALVNQDLWEHLDRVL